MAKKQLKKLNQPKKYLQGGSNMASVAQTRQNPYYIGQVNANAAEEEFQSSQDQLAQARLDAAQAQKDAREAENQQLDATVRAGASNMVKAVATDQKAGNLGRFMLPPITTAGPATAVNTGIVNPSTGKALTMTLGKTTGGTQGVNFSNLASQGATVAGEGAGVAGRVGLMGSNMSALGAGAIGVAANIGGKIIQKRADDNSAYTFTDKERRGNVGGSALSSAGTGFSTGAVLGSFVPGLGNVVGGLIGAGIGAGVGALKARKENKASQEEADRLQAEQAAIRGAYQSAFVNSRLTSADTGFGLNSSTNMNNNFTGQYQVARDGGVTGIQGDRRPKKVPGGKIVPIEGTDAVEFVGRTHAQGGILIDKNTEVEGGGKNGQGETMDQVVMNNNNKQDYIFSKYLKIGGKSFAQRHKDILKGSGSQSEIQQLAAMQEKVAGRDSKQVAAYGGFHKYLEGGVKPCPECPPGTICDITTGNCVADEDAPTSSYEWNATGLEGFKAKQQTATPAATTAKQEPAKPTGPTASKADMNDAWKMYMANKKAEEIAAQNGTANAPADNKVAANTAKTPNGYTPVKLPFTALESEKFDPKGKMQAWARGEGKAMMDKSMAESEAYDAEKKKAIDANNTYNGRSKDGFVDDYKYDPATGEYTGGKQAAFNEPILSTIPQRIVYKDGKPLYMNDEGDEPYTATAYRETPEDVAKLQKEGYYKKKDGEGTTSDWREGAWKDGKFVDFKDDPAFAVKQGYDVPGYTAPAGVQPPSKNTPPVITDAEKKQAMDQLAALDADWAAGKISSKDEYNAKRVELFKSPAFNAAIDDRSSGSNPTPYNSSSANNQPQPPAQPTLADDIDKMWADKGYVKDANGDWVLAEEVQQQNTTPAYTPPAGITPPAAPTTPPATTQTNTGTPTPPPPAATAADGFVAPAKRATSTGAATGTPQTPEEKEAARLAGLPRLFMGANRKVDETTGEVTAYTDKPLMGVGAMAGSRLGTATGSQEDLAKVTRNSYDQAWTNKADNLYTNQKDASGGGLSSSDAIADRDKIAESNWGKKYGYSKGMSAEDAKKAHGKFAEDVHSLFKNNPDEMMGYFQYIIDGGVNNPKAPGTYLGKDAEQIRNNLTKKGFIGADGRPIAGKEKEMAAYLENQATNNAVGPIHNALGSFTAERGSTRIKLEEQKKKEVEKPVQELPKKFEPCPPGTYRSGDGTCKDLGDVPQAARISGTLMAGLGQLIPVGAALANPYKIAPGIMGTAAVKGALMPRVNLNQERASNIQQNVAYRNAVINQNAGPGALAAMQMANTKTNEQMLKIAQQEQDSNRQLASEEGKMGMQASMFNAENEQKRQMFNTEFNQKERQYRREDILGALDTGASRIAGIVKDDRAYKAQERFATGSDETGSYQRFTTYEDLAKDAKRKNSPYYGKSDSELRRIAAAMYKELNPEGYVSKSEYTKLQEEKTKLQKERDEAEKKNQAKFGGARQYVSRLGQLSGVRATKAKL
jgi:hypothetical protein